MATQPDSIAQLLAAAQAARSSNDPTTADQKLAQAAMLVPDDPRVNNALGMSALASGDNRRARDHFMAATIADPAAVPLFINLATAYRSLGDDAGEESALLGAAQINQREFMPQLRLAELYQRQGKGRESALRWRNVVQMTAGVVDLPPIVSDAVKRGNAYLADHNAQLQGDVDRALGKRISELGPAARRFSACLDYSLGRRKIYTNQCEGVHFPFLPADEYFDRSFFPWLDALEQRAPKIREEALKLLSTNSEAIRPYVHQEAGTPQNKWSSLDQKLDWGACFLWEYGKRNDAVCALCPETAAALEAAPQAIIPGNAPSAFFSILRPRTHIPPHTGVTNTRAIIHLPLVVPDGCRFRVGGETRVWKEGEAFAFDDTIDHEAWNDSDDVRIVLIFDVWNPHLSTEECALLSDFFALTEAKRSP
ncbi:MAG: aspartyl/asparaginyl beta-hydroxylase domain-containing protein [Sphingopyxis sp.]